MHSSVSGATSTTWAIVKYQRASHTSTANVASVDQKTQLLALLVVAYWAPRLRPDLFAPKSEIKERFTPISEAIHGKPDYESIDEAISDANSQNENDYNPVAFKDLKARVASLRWEEFPLLISDSKGNPINKETAERAMKSTFNRDKKPIFAFRQSSNPYGVTVMYSKDSRIATTAYDIFQFQSSNQLFFKSKIIYLSLKGFVSFYSEGRLPLDRNSVNWAEVNPQIQDTGENLHNIRYQIDIFQKHEAFFSLNRFDAERHLQGEPCKTFLLRPGSIGVKDNRVFVISYLSINNRVEHLEIKIDNQGKIVLQDHEKEIVYICDYLQQDPNLFIPEKRCQIKSVMRGLLDQLFNKGLFDRPLTIPTIGK